MISHKLADICGQHLLDKAVVSKIEVLLQEEQVILSFAGVLNFSNEVAKALASRIFAIQKTRTLELIFSDISSKHELLLQHAGLIKRR